MIFKYVLAALLICIIFSIDSLRDAGGNITDETVARHSQMVGSFGKTLDKIFLEAADVPQREFIVHEKNKFSDDLKEFVKLLYPEELFKEIPNRSFGAFHHFKFDVNSNFPLKLKNKIQQRSKELDKIRRNTTM